MATTVTLTKRYVPKTYVPGSFSGVSGTSGGSSTSTPTDLTVYAPKASPIFTGEVNATGVSDSWGVYGTGGYNTIMGTGGSATWLIKGTSGGVHRGGIQLLDGGADLRIYASTHFLGVDATGIFHSNGEGYLAPKVSPTFTGTVTSTTLNISNTTGYLLRENSGSGYGIYKGATDRIGIAANGSEYLTVLSDGKVGIGTTTPTATLDLQHATLPQIDFHTGINKRADIRASSTALFLNSITGNDIQFQTDDNTRMSIRNDGNVGIGTTAPASQLEVHGNGAATNTSIRLSNSNYNTNYNTVLGMTNGAQGRLQFGNNDDNEIRFGATNVGGYGSFYTNNTAAWDAATNGTLAMRLLNTGNVYFPGSVGIGTNDPEDIKLDVLGDTRLLTTSYLSGFNGNGMQLVKSGSNYDLELDNLIVRKAMTVYELIIKKIRAIGGSFWVSSAHKIKTVSYVNPTYTVLIDRDGSNIAVEFAVNDILRCQAFNGRGVKYYSAIVTSLVTDGFTMIKTDGSGTPEIGDDLVKVGNSTDAARQSSIYMTTSDSNAPFIDVMNGVNSYSFTSSNVKVRLGLLTGITDAEYGALSGYGLYADNVFLKGKITATSGAIGGWTLTSNALTAGSGATTVGLSSAVTGGDDVRIYAGSSTPTSAPFRVTETGVLTATSGTIGGFTLSSTKLSAGSVATTISLDTANGIHLGATAFASAPFRVTLAGALTATNATITGSVTATSGTIGGWTIQSTYIAKDTGTAATSSGMAPTDYPFYAGQTYANRATAPFRVTPAGTAIASKFITSYIIGSDIIGRIDLQYSTSSATYVKLQQMTLGADIQGTKTLRITFHLRSSGANNTYARIYRNGVAVGTERNSPNATGSMFTEDISGWAAGDLIQVYAHGTSGTNTAYVKEFRLRGSHFDFTNEVSTTLEPNIQVKATQFLYVDHDRPQPLAQLDDDSATLQVYLNGSASTIYLPLTPTLGRTFIISNISAVNLTVSIATGSGDSIFYAGSSVSTVVYGQHRCMTLIYIGSNFWVVSSFT